MSPETGEAVKALLEQAVSQLREEDFDGAIESFSAVLAIAPKDAKAHQGRGVARLRTGNWEGALSDFSRARELDPNDPESWVGLGASLATGKKVYEAIDVFNELLKNHPHYTRGHIQLGLLYYKLCVTAKGRKHMEAALRCRPTLEERRLIEATLKNEKILDAKRYYRPDFEELKRRERGSSFSLAKIIVFFKGLFSH